LKKDKHSAVFRKPVDPVALNIPSYFSIIKHPMDLSTVEKKLQQSKYPTVASLIDDVRLIFRNCELFNGYDSVFGKLARTVEGIFDSLLKKMPNQVRLYTGSYFPFHNLSSFLSFSFPSVLFLIIL